jgi:hypothetical protein
VLTGRRRCVGVVRELERYGRVRMSCRVRRASRVTVARGARARRDGAPEKKRTQVDRVAASIAASLLALVVLASNEAAAQPTSEVPREWYGWQTLVVDGASIGVQTGPLFGGLIGGVLGSTAAIAIDAAVLAYEPTSKGFAFVVQPVAMPGGFGLSSYGTW